MSKRPAIISLFLPYGGCGHRCIFCNQEICTEQTDALTPEEVTTFLDDSVPKIDRTKFSGVEVAFYGGTFTDMPEETQMRYCDAVHPFIEKGCVDSIRVSTRPDAVNAPLLQRLFNRGVRIIEIGVQSFDDDVLLASRRGYDASIARGSCALVKESGFRLGIHLMQGLPGDTPEKSIVSAQTAAEFHPALIRLHPTLVFEGTELARLYRSGSYRVWPFNKMVDTLCEIITLLEHECVTIGRIGVQLTDAMRRPGAIVAGEEFLNIRDACMSRLFFEKIRKALPLVKGPMRVRVHPKDVSWAVGTRRENIQRLEKEIGGYELRIVPDRDIPRGEVAVELEKYK